MLTKLAANWKSTVMGLLVLLLALDHAVKFDAMGHLAMTCRDWTTAAGGLMALVIGWLQVDAGHVPVLAPDGETVNAPSHEMPDDPKDVVAK